MSDMKSFAIAGVGRMGKPVAEELLKLKANGAVSKFVILTRSPNLADAAKAAGVKLFIPSEWSLYSKGITDGFWISHNRVHKHIEEIGLPYALVFTGQSELTFSSFLGWNIPAGRVTIFGDGNSPITWTTSRDAARFVAHTLTTFAAKQLAGRVISIEGDRKTLNELVAAYTTRTGKKLEVTYKPVSEQESILKGSSPFAWEAIVAWILVAWEKGAADLRTSPEGLANKWWPEWNPKSAVDAMVESM
ncbi:NAD(P)-binding protein [Heliocybe sulcata]|uniref:NAD(P)-binding protein n=1 Tax=Heliocybe sulcata TaxID=5364 RepID=A0A5C3MR83_9AGAM|nr:NAD(P)-binding protein [Heliocybe sulcata]